MAVKPYPETHQHGVITMEGGMQELIANGAIEANLGIQVAGDGRIWICINGIAAIRFLPQSKYGKYGGKGPVHVAKPASGAAILNALGIDKEGNEIEHKPGIQGAGPQKQS